MTLETVFNSEVRALLGLAVLLLLPGWAFLSITQLWKRFEGLQRWAAAVGISIAAYPVLFYSARILLPQLHIGRNKLVIFLGACLLLALWGLRKSLRAQFRFDRLETWAVLVFALTLFIRFWMAHIHPYPAWSDSLHHTMLTQLTAANGQLPYTLEPYESVPLGMYHLGLYSLSGSLQIITGISFHTALLWTAQALNGLGVVSIYLVLDRLAGRRAALAGAAVAGIFSLQPAWYVNWGRFTQVSAQSIMLTAWFFTFEAMQAVRSEWPKWRKGASVWLILAAALLNASTFLLHYRVAAYYLPLLIITVLYLLVQSVREKQIPRWLTAVLLIGSLSVLFILPAAAQAIPAYLARSSGSYNPAAVNLEYFETPWKGLFISGVQKWLVIGAALGALLGLVLKKKLTVLTLLWVALLLALGNTYRLGIRVLNVTNLSAIFIMLYMPVSLLIATGIQTLADRFAGLWKRVEGGLLPAVLIFAIFLGGYQRMNGVEEYRYFMTSADEQAMKWVAANTPADAIFAINTMTWAGGSPHGTDGGYWLPYFTGRRTTSGTMLYSLAGREHTQEIIDYSQAAMTLQGADPQVEALCSLGVDYAYIGVNGNFASAGLDKDAILTLPGTSMLYEKAGVAVIKICQ